MSSTVGGPLRVAVACEQSLVSDAVRTALVSREVQVAVLRWPGDQGVPRPRRRPQHQGHDVGLLISDLDTARRVGAASLLIKRVAVPWVVITGAEPGPLWGAVIEAGAGCVRPSATGLEEIVEVLTAVATGKLTLAPAMRAQLLDQWYELREQRDRVAGGLQRLTPREREVLRLLYAGESIARIAELLEVSRATVRSQVKAVLRKLDVNSQLGAVAVVGDMASYSGAPGDELLSTP